jgi:hypothetical protein
MNKTLVGFFIAGGIVVAIGGYVMNRPSTTSPRTPSTPTAPSAVVAQGVVSLSGTYTCLPLLDGSTPQNDCAFGVKTDAGEFYAVNFGASAGSMADFKAGAHITAKGTIIPREKLRPDNWKKFSMTGLFTITEKPLGE